MRLDGAAFSYAPVGEPVAGRILGALDVVVINRLQQPAKSAGLITSVLRDAFDPCRLDKVNCFTEGKQLGGLTAIALNTTNLSLQEALASQEVRALRLRAHVRAREGDEGHVLARHHPSLTDQQLMDRLLKGLDSEGKPAPTSGISSRFISEEVFLQSLRNVHTEMASALTRTRRLLEPNIASYSSAVSRFDQAHGAQKCAALQHFKEASADLMAAIQSLCSLPDHLPVLWDNARRCIILYPSYAINVYHGMRVGTGFYGTKPQPKTISAGTEPKGLTTQCTLKTYKRVHPFNSPLDNTLTLFATPNSPMNALGRLHTVANWGLITHYPQHHDERGGAYQRQ